LADAELLLNGTDCNADDAVQPMSASAQSATDDDDDAAVTVPADADTVGCCGSVMRDAGGRPRHRVANVQRPGNEAAEAAAMVDLIVRETIFQPRWKTGGVLRLVGQ
jgi:hypothetical protein